MEVGNMMEQLEYDPTASLVFPNRSCGERLSDCIREFSDNLTQLKIQLNDIQSFEVRLKEREQASIQANIASQKQAEMEAAQEVHAAQIARNAQAVEVEQAVQTAQMQTNQQQPILINDVQIGDIPMVLDSLQGVDLDTNILGNNVIDDINDFLAQVPTTFDNNIDNENNQYDNIFDEIDSMLNMN